jgi:hypothetical protein
MKYWKEILLVILLIYFLTSLYKEVQNLSDDGDHRWWHVTNKYEEPSNENNRSVMDSKIYILKLHKYENNISTDTYTYLPVSRETYMNTSIDSTKYIFNFMETGECCKLTQYKESNNIFEKLMHYFFE